MERGLPKTLARSTQFPRNVMTSLNHRLVFAWVVLCAALAVPSQMRAAEFYVATDGSDSNAGGIGQPFRTIQRAAQVMVPGDVCVIRGGTYREMVTPSSGTAAQPIVYRAYPGETVTISGCDLVTGWVQLSGNIYKAPQTAPLSEGSQIFVNQKMVLQARWPNNPASSLLEPPLATAETGSTNTSINCSALPAVDLTGAGVWIISGARWEGWTSRITRSAKGKIDLTNNVYSALSSRPGANFYVFGPLALLDSENEWAADSQFLYLWVPGGGDPSSRIVESKVRSLGIDLAGKTDLRFENIRLLGCSIQTSASTANIVIDRMTAHYVGHWESPGDNFNPPAGQKSGIYLGGKNIIVRNSTFAYAAGNILTLSGSGHQVINCLIHDAAYSGINAECLGLYGTGHFVSHNTIHSSGRSVVGLGASRSLIQYNDVFRAGLLTWDVGLITTGNTDGGNSEIHHNWFHDNLSSGLARGIFLSTGAHNYLIHHNVVWNCWEGGYHGEPPSEYVQLFHNTFYSTPGSYDAGGVDISSSTYVDDQVGGMAINNVFTDSIRKFGHDVTVVNNLTANIDPQFVNPAAFDFRLKPTSPGIGKGIIIPGINFSRPPDLGAYEGGDWKPGHDFVNPPNPSFHFSDNPFRNRVANFSFEFDFDPWIATGAKAGVSLQNVNADPTTNTNGLVHSNRWGARLASGACGVEQTISGLSPNTTYVLTAWAKLSAAASQAELGIRSPGSPEKSRRFDGTGQAVGCWLRRSVAFVTGPSDTTATVFVRKNSEAAGDDVLIDDIGLAQSFSSSPRLTTGRADSTLNIGTGLNEFEFGGSWHNASSWTAGSYAQVRFVGEQVVLYGKIQQGGGIAAISIDGGPETLVDCYYPQLPHHATSQPIVPIYLSPILAPGPHTLKVRVTGTKNPSSGGYDVRPVYVNVISGDR
jgi:hypothetical protein